MSSSNGEAIIPPSNNVARGLANYPAARKAGSFLFVSGCSSRQPDGTGDDLMFEHDAEVKPDGTVEFDIQKQTRGVIEKIKEVLKTAGASLENLVELNVFLTNMADYNGFNEVYNEYFTEQGGPARTTVAVKELPHPYIIIEIKGIALAP
ncbi:hypothetical protein SmJEL517_g00059 [Synchytrium microbalum]|uniref:2-aminomuconate deaminase n=1 Tax=Synchytrium microbalum TaxID=1806994 RepID=A0A507CFJ8_9FUNG|nr:uncharacterized protein SmJEL517_g00059 [Synchytrium microbalum]TPX38271.1 hypothetical protein SmJEL517_g00059 [Synchytrium microbalum]